HTLPSHTGRDREARTNSHANSDPPPLEPTSAHGRAAETPREHQESAVATQIEAARRRLASLSAPGRQPIGSAGLSGTSLRDFSVALELVGVVADQLEEENEELAAVLKEVQAELHHYQELFRLAPDGFLVTDAVGMIVEANAASANLLHNRQDDLTGKPVDLFMTDVENVTIEGQLNRLRHGQEIRGWEVSVQPT